MAKKVKKTKSSDTPLMRQYNEIKTKYPDAMLLFRVGDFYELFNDDARKASKILGIVLTCLLYTSPSPRDGLLSRMPSSA